MKNLKVYLVCILLPLVFIGWLIYTGHDTLFLISLIGYVVYRKIIDCVRLISIGVVPEKDRVKCFFIPFYTVAYSKELYFRV